MLLQIHHSFKVMTIYNDVTLYHSDHLMGFHAESL
jgi:hypothetical protein